MNIYIIYFFTIILTILFFILIKDKVKALKLIGILTISSSFLLIIITFIIKILLINNITIINISRITNYIFKKFINTSLILFISGIIEILISKYIISKRISNGETVET